MGKKNQQQQQQANVRRAKKGACKTRVRMDIEHQVYVTEQHAGRMNIIYTILSIDLYINVYKVFHVVTRFWSGWRLRRHAAEQNG